MSKIGLFYSSSTGNTKETANAIKAEFDKHEDDLVTLHYVTDGPLTDMLAYETLVLVLQPQLVQQKRSSGRTSETATVMGSFRTGLVSSPPKRPGQNLFDRVSDTPHKSIQQSPDFRNRQWHHHGERGHAVFWACSA